MQFPGMNVYKYCWLLNIASQDLPSLYWVFENDFQALNLGLHSCICLYIGRLDESAAEPLNYKHKHSTFLKTDELNAIANNVKLRTYLLLKCFWIHALHLTESFNHKAFSKLACVFPLQRSRVLAH